MAAFLSDPQTFALVVTACLTGFGALWCAGNRIWG